MKGVLFTGLIDMIETQYSPAVADAILTPPGLASGGIYTSVGVYEYREFDQLLRRLAEHVGASRADVLKKFGRAHFQRLMKMYPHLVSGLTDTFALLSRVDRPIHSTVVDVHASAEVPELTFTLESPTRGQLNYRSARSMADMAEGLIYAAIDHFKEEIRVERVHYSTDGNRGEQACFVLTKVAAH